MGNTWEAIILDVHAKSLRIECRDDKGTLVTVTDENDVQDAHAVRSCKSVRAIS